MYNYNKKNGETVKKFVTQNDTPKQEKIPIFGLKWSGKNKAHPEGYTKLYFSSGKLYVFATEDAYSNFYRNFKEKNKNFLSYIVAPKKEIRALYVNHNKRLKMLEFSIVKTDGKREKENKSPKKWEFEERYFLFKNDPTIYNQWGYPVLEQNKVGYSKDFECWLWKIQGIKLYSKASIEELSSFTEEKIDYLWGFTKWYKLSFMNYAPKKQEKLKTIPPVKEYKEEELKNIKGKIVYNEHPMRVYYIGFNFCIFEPINTDWGCFRFFTRGFSTYSWWSSTGKTEIELNNILPIEKNRIYVSRKQGIIALENAGENLVVSSRRYYNLIGWSDYSFINPNKLYNWIGNQNLKEYLNQYIATAAIPRIGQEGEWNGTMYRSTIEYITSPTMEKLINAGYYKIANWCLSDNPFKINKKAGSIYAACGLSKNILNFIEKGFMALAPGVSQYYLKHNIIFCIKMMKLLYSNYNSWDKTKVEKFFKNLINNNHYYYEHDFTVQRNRTDWFSTKEEKEVLQKIFEISYKSPEIISCFVDITRTYNSLIDETAKASWYELKNAKNLNDLTKHHNYIVEVYNAQQRNLIQIQNELKKKELQKFKEKILPELQEKFNYSPENENFFIRAAEDETEIINEGRNLGHCVGGYASRHLGGTTKILFLRKKETPSLSFYTIEVNPQDTIVQIHGKYNKWLGNNPECINFVARWIKEKQLICHKKLLLSKSTHYSCGNDFLNENDYII